MIENRNGGNEPEDVWDYIKYLRKQRGYNLIRFSELIDCTPVHAGRIEKPYSVSHCAASVKLLKRIAAVCADDMEPRDLLEKNLLMRRAKMRYSKEVAEDLYLNPESYPQLYSDGMTKEFIQRLQNDTRGIRKSNALVTLAMTHEELKAVLEGRLLLSRRKVLDLARKLKQPVEEYMLLAGYITDGIRNLFTDSNFLALMKRARKLSPEEIKQLGTAMGSMLSLIKKPSDKKKEGS